MYGKLEKEAGRIVEKASRQCEEIQKRIETYQKQQKKGEEEKEREPINKEIKEEYMQTIRTEREERMKKCKKKIEEIERKVKEVEEDYRETIDSQDKLIGNIIRAMEELKKKKLHETLIHNMRQLEQEKMTNTKIKHIDNENKENIEKQKREQQQQTQQQQQQEIEGGGTNIEEDELMNSTSTNSQTTTITTSTNQMMQKDMMTQSMYYKTKQSLHDFVNKNNIETLFQQAQEAKEYIEEIHGMSRQLFLTINDQYENIESRMNSIEDQLKDNENNHKNTLNEQELMEKFNEMQTIMLQMNTYVHSLQVVKSSPLFSSFNMKTLETQLEDMKKKVPLMNKLDKEIRHMLGNSGQINRNEIEENIREIMKDIETLEAATKSNENSFYALINRYNKAKYENKTIELFTEIRDLTRWYEYFPIAYDNLLVEIDRRHRAQKTFQERIQQMTRELEATYEEEQHSRMQFYENFGQFLPATLCPQLGKPADKATIHVEASDMDLPKVVLTEAQKQLIHERTMKMK
mmetsp:Transcript_2039/g.2935  ORF Transcript_2039/g.2935 Transcript_2039/m.2935 type:complete len:519 (-) Transcript_2039:368-1924(-)